MTLHYVPIVNLAPYFSGEPDGKAAVAQAVNQACKDIGFLVITEHQIPAALIERVSGLTRQFFDLPLAEERQFTLRDCSPPPNTPLHVEHSPAFAIRKIRVQSAVIDESGNNIVKTRGQVTQPRNKYVSTALDGRVKP